MAFSKVVLELEVLERERDKEKTKKRKKERERERGFGSVMCKRGDIVRIRYTVVFNGKLFFLNGNYLLLFMNGSDKDFY